MAFIKISGIDIYHEIHGEGEPIVLLHNGFSCTKMWKDIYPQLVEAGYRIINYDRRGFGQSKGGRGFRDFYLSDGFRAEGVREMKGLMDLLGLDSFHILGQCEGGVLGIDFAVEYPERVKTLMTSSTQCFSTMPMTELGMLKFPDPFVELEPKLKKKIIYWHGEGSAENFYNLLRGAGGAYGQGYFDIREQLPKVKCPSLVRYPDRSFLFPVEQGVAMYRGLARGELAVLPRCGHNTYEHQPKEYVENVLKFLERHGY
jgi:pimeloyl-ACP methyl ester carboxylesterase